MARGMLGLTDKIMPAPTLRRIAWHRVWAWSHMGGL